MIHLNLPRKLLNTLPVRIEWVIDKGDQFDFFDIFYEYRGIEYLIINYLSAETRSYIWNPPKVKGTITIKIVGYIREGKQKLLTYDSNNIYVTNIEGVAEGVNILYGNSIQVLNKKEGITCSSIYDKTRIVMGEAHPYTSYKINDKDIIKVYPSEEGVLQQWKKLMQNQNISKISPEPIEIYPSYIKIVNTSGITLFTYEIPKVFNPEFFHCTYIPLSVTNTSPNYIPTYAQVTNDETSLLLSLRTKDIFNSVKTNEKGEYNTGKILFPGYISLALGMEIVKVKAKADYNNYLFVYEGGTKGIVLQENLLFNPLDYSFEGEINRADIEKDFIVKRSSSLISVGSLKVAVYDEYKINGLSGVLIKVDENSAYTNSSGIALFSDLPVNTYKVNPQNVEGYKRYTFEPTTKEVDITSGVETFTIFTSIPKYSIEGKIKNQYNDELVQPIDIEIRDLRRESEDTLPSVIGSYSTGYSYRNGSYRVSAIYKNIQFQPQNYIINLGPEDAVNIDFKTNTYRITGRVYDLNQSGISGATINVYNDFIEEPTLTFDENGITVDEHGEPFYSVKTDSSGVFIIDLLPSEYTIRAEHKSYNVEALIEWLKSTEGLGEDSVFILLLREYLSSTSEEEKEELMKSIIEAGGEYGISGELLNSLLTSGVVTKYFFQPNQRHITLNKNTYRQDFFREPTYNISGKFIDAKTGEGVSGVNYWLMTSNSRMLYPQSYYKVNGKDYSNEAIGKVCEANSFPDGSYLITGLLPGEYYVIPLKQLDEWQQNVTEDGEEYWEWVKILSTDEEGYECPWNYGYIFKPENIRTYLLNNNINGLDIDCYTGKVYGEIVDTSGIPISGIKVELLGGEYKYQRTDEGDLIANPKQTNTNTSGIYLFEYQKPEELYTLHLFKETRDNSFYHYNPETDPSKRTTIPDDTNWEQNFTGIEYPKYIIKGNVVDTSGIPIQTEVYAEDGEQEPPSILHGWKEEQKKEGFEIPKYTFSGITNENGNYEITVKLPATYEIYPASYGYNYNPILYQKDIKENTSGIDFIGKPIPPDEESTCPHGKYNVKGKVIDAWDRSGISNIPIDLVYFQENNNKKFTTKTDEDGFYTFNNLSKGEYFIYPEESISYKIWPMVPYYIHITNNNISGLDFELIFAYKVTGKVTYEDGEPIPNLSILFTQSHSLVKQVNIETGESIWNYTSGLFHPIIKEDWIGGKVIVNEGKHNLLYFNNKNELVLQHGQYFSGNSIPVPPCKDLTKGLSYPIDVEHSPRQFFRIVSFGNKSIDSLIINKDNVKALESLLLKDESFILCREDLFAKFGEECYTSLFDKFLKPEYEVSGGNEEINGQVDYIRQHKSIVGLKVESINDEITAKEIFSFPKTDLGFDIKNFVDIIIKGTGEANIILYDYTLVIKNKWNIILEDNEFLLEG